MDVKELRSSLGLSQEQFAKKIGVSVRTVANWEAGKVIPASKMELLQGLQPNMSQTVTQTGDNAQNVQGNGNQVLPLGSLEVLNKALDEIAEQRNQLARVIDEMSAQRRFYEDIFSTLRDNKKE